MRRLLLAALILLAAVPAGGQIIQPGIIPGHVFKCDYYASPSGSSSNSGKTQSAPIRITDFWSKPSLPGKTLCLMSGTYTGSAQMIAPTSGISGTSGNPIIVRALNEGQVLIDAQFARDGIFLDSNDWLVIEGVNSRNSRNGSIYTISSDNNIIRRTVVWDIDITRNRQTVRLLSSHNNLLEDVAIFGTGRHSFLNQSGGTGNVLRRVWSRWEGSIVVGPKGGLHLSYADGPGVTCENCLASWTAESMPETYCTIDGVGDPTTDCYTNFGVENTRNLLGHGVANGACINSDIFGSLAYLRPNVATAGDNHPASGFQTRGSCVHIKHTMVFIPPTHPEFNDMPGFLLGDLRDTLTDIGAERITSVSKSDSIISAWSSVTTGYSRGTTLASVPNPWTSTSSGANLCYRWVNGAVTTQPLWPWPMNDRIKAATGMAGAYAGPCTGCSGGRATRTPTDVTAEIESLLGTIPAACRS